MKTKILISSIIFICSFLIVLLINPNLLNDLLEKLAFNAVSILVGLSIAVVGIFLGSINSMYLSIYKIVKTKNQTILSDKEVEKIKYDLSGIVDELKDNAIFSLATFLLVLLLFFLKAANIPSIHWFIDTDQFTKEFFINFLILAGNFFIFYAIMDSIKVVFKITKAFELMKDE